MECTCVRHTELPNTSKLFADFVYHFDRVSSFYAHSPFDPAGYAAAASRIDLPAARRAGARVADSERRQRIARPSGAAGDRSRRHGAAGGLVLGSGLHDL